MSERIRDPSSPPREYHMISGSVLDRVRPDDEEMETIAAIVDSVISRSRELKIDMGIDFGMVHVGSTAKGTNLRNGDVDIFYTFDPSMMREALHDFIVTAGNLIFREPEIRYAEHPYVTVICTGIDSAGSDRVPRQGASPVNQLQRARPSSSSGQRAKLRDFGLPASS